jgi:hypothetical protein
MGDPILFVVRVWSDGGGFRACVRNVDSEEARLFEHSLDIAHYLQEQSKADSIDDDGER